MKRGEIPLLICLKKEKEKKKKSKKQQPCIARVEFGGKNGIMGRKGE